MNNKKSGFLVLSLLIVAFLVFQSGTAYADSYPKTYQSTTMDGLNKILKDKGVRELEIDPKLCEAVEKYSNELENSYPNPAPLILANPKYNDLMSNYWNVENITVSKLDMLIKFEQDTFGKVEPFTVDDLKFNFLNLESNDLALNTKYSTGCVAISDGARKPYMIFMVAEKKSYSVIKFIPHYWNLLKLWWGNK